MPANVITVLPDEPIGTIRPELHGQFAEHLGGCVYGGLWVGPDSAIPNDAGLRLDVLRALQRIRVPVLRWPGGCFADDYHWADGVGPVASRPRRFNAWWGHDVEDNRFGTHEFLRLCQLIGSKPYLAGNVGTGTPAELKDWVEYTCFPGDTTLARRRATDGHAAPYDVRYWGVGNESWGCGGSMTAAEYAGQYARFATYLNTFTRPPTHLPLYLIAAGPDRNNLDWTREFFTTLANRRPGDTAIHGYGAHYYAGSAGTATEFTADQWYHLLHNAVGVEQLIVEQRALMNEMPAARHVGLILDEWGTWHPPTLGKWVNHLWQQNTLRDALVAALTLDLFNRHADKLVMANIAQVTNVLQAMVLTDGDRMALTPTYHVFDLYKHHQAGTSLRTVVTCGEVRFAKGNAVAKLPILSASASVKAGQLTLSVVNVHTSWPIQATLDLSGRTLADVTIDTLTDDDLTAHNTFDAPDRLTPRRAAPHDAMTHSFPPASVTVIRGRLA
jgi:alpha-N-arabinofuranosidase